MEATTSARQPDLTRRRILEAAFREFYRHGFQGGSLSRIVEAAGTTKGALFHHFAGKQQLGYAVVDEVIEPLLMTRWVGPLSGSDDPIGVLQSSFRRYVREDIESGSWLDGCPLNNLAQEMSPLDEGFRTRILRLYDRWRATVAASLSAGIGAGTVRSDVVPGSAAALIVAAQMGIWGTGKSSRDASVLVAAAEAACQYLEQMRPPTVNPRGEGGSR